MKNLIRGLRDKGTINNQSESTEAANGWAGDFKREPPLSKPDRGREYYRTVPESQSVAGKGFMWETGQGQRKSMAVQDCVTSLALMTQQ